MVKLVGQRVLSLGVLLTLMILTGCVESSSEPNHSTSQDPVSKEAPFVIKPEIYGDSDIFDGPRIQFAMKAPGDNRDTIWSIKTDGSDLRQAVNNQLLRGEADAVFNHPPVRSPDNRYIAISMMTSEGLEKQIIDLKTNTKITFAKGGGIPLFQWTSDSKEVFFHMDQNLWRYHVDRKTMTKEVKIGYQGTYYLRDKDQFFVVQEDGFELFDRQGESIRKVVLNTQWGLKEWHLLSSDGTRFVYHQQRGGLSYIIDLDNPHKVLLESEYWLHQGAFAEANNKIYFGRGIVFALDINTRRVQKLYLPPAGAGGISKITLVNE